MVEFLLLVANHPNAAGKAFNIADSAISTHELIQNFAEGMGKKPWLFSFPRAFWRIVLRVAGKQKMYEQLFEDLVLDTTLAERGLGWKSKYQTTEALRETGQRFWELHQKRKAI